MAGLLYLLNQNNLFKKMDRKLVFNIMPLKVIFLILKILNLNTNKLKKNSTKNKYEKLL